MPDISEVATNLHRLSNVLGRVADRTLQDEYGLGMSQFKILWILRKHGEGVLQTNIADWCNQTEAAISRQINLLKRDKLIEKIVDPKNRRNHIIHLSNKGREFADEAMGLLVKEYKPLFSVLTKSQQDVLNQLLEKVFFKVVKSFDH